MKTKDNQLIQILKLNSRISVTDLAKELGVSRTTAQQKLNRLEENNIITGYTVKLNENYITSRIQAHINIKTDPNHTSHIVSSLEKISAIELLQSVSGNMDLIAIVDTESSSELDQLLDEISKIPGIISTETALVLSTKFDRR